MVDSYGGNFPSYGFNPGHIHQDNVTGGIYRYLGGDPSDTVNNWLLVWGKLESDPNTSSWGIRQDGATWFNSTTNQQKLWDGSAVLIIQSSQAASQVISIGMIIDGGGSAIIPAIKGDVRVPFACTINLVTILADQLGAIQIDIWKNTLANYPPTVANTITAGAVPKIIASGTNSQDATLIGWTKALADGDTLRFNVDSCTTITRAMILLKATRG